MNASALPKLTIAILAAGFSSRLGLPKALARVRGMTLMRRTLVIARQVAPAKIIVVLPRRAVRYRAEARGLDVVFATNPDRALGLSTSVRRAIAKARFSSALLLLPVDLPALQGHDLARLVLRWRGARRCVIARRIGNQGGTPLILPRWLYSRAPEITGDIGLRELVHELPRHQRVLVNLPSATLDVDTPEDLRAARNRAWRARVA